MTKQSVLTGEYIHEQIQIKRQELQQYNAALRELKPKGTVYAPYKLLNAEARKVELDLRMLLDQKYTILEKDVF